MLPETIVDPSVCQGEAKGRKESKMIKASRMDMVKSNFLFFACMRKCEQFIGFTSRKEEKKKEKLAEKKEQQDEIE